MKRSLTKSALALFFVCVLVLSGCTQPAAQPSAAPAQPAAGTAAPASQPTPQPEIEPAKQIVFWSTKSDMFAEQTDIFTQQTGISVSSTYMGGYDDMVDKVMAGIAANDLPNVAQLGQRHGLSQMFDSGRLLPIENYVPQELMDDIIPEFWKRFTYKDSRVILPFQNSMPVLYYNNDLMKAAGVSQPNTFAEVVSAAKTIKDTTGQYGLSLNSDYPWYILALMFNSGVAPISSEGTANMSTPETIALFEQIRTLAITDQSMPANQHKTAQEDFSNGKLGMFLGSCASYEKIKKLVDGKFEVGIALFPEIATRDIPMGGNGLGIFKSTPEGEKASAMFIEFMLEKERVANGSLNSGYIPVTNASISTDIYKEYLADPNRAVVHSQMQYLGGASVNPADSLIWNEINDLVDAIEADPNVDIAKRLGEIDEKINKYLSQYAG